MSTVSLARSAQPNREWLEYPACGKYATNSYYLSPASVLLPLTQKKNKMRMFHVIAEFLRVEGLHVARLRATVLLLVDVTECSLPFVCRNHDNIDHLITDSD